MKGEAPGAAQAHRRCGPLARLTLEQVREGANTILRVGDYEFPVPRHSEINEHTAQAIMKDLADQLGEDWSRR